MPLGTLTVYGGCSSVATDVMAVTKVCYRQQESGIACRFNQSSPGIATCAPHVPRCPTRSDEQTYIEPRRPL